jgi:hypothetical protein
MPPKHRFVCLVPAGGDEKFLSVPYSPQAPAAIEHFGKLYRRTQQRTAGGWVVYREVE